MGNHVAGVLEPQAILHQTLRPSDGDDLMKHLAETLPPQASAEDTQRTGMGQSLRDRELQKIAKRHVGGRPFDDLAIRKVVSDNLQILPTMSISTGSMAGCPTIGDVVGTAAATGRIRPSKYCQGISAAHGPQEPGPEKPPDRTPTAATDNIPRTAWLCPPKPPDGRWPNATRLATNLVSAAER